MDKKINKLLGFGCMRLPMNGTNVDLVEFQKMVDTYMSNGFNYFDTARVYIGGLSEKAIKECVSKKYDRESFILTDKLTGSCFEKEEDIFQFFESQLESCGVEYFDYYLMHAQNRNNYKKFMACHAYEKAVELKKIGKIRHIGISFHDTADILEQILIEHPEIEVVQIQFNYLDYYSPNVQSKLLYDLLRKYNKYILVMEPVKGGTLANIPDSVKPLFEPLKSSNSYASYAIRFVASHEGIIQILSGMSNLSQMEDNISYMKDFVPLTIDELGQINKIRQSLYELNGVPCTSCRYCVDGCPQKIIIPELFSLYNESILNKVNNKDQYFKHSSLASRCIKCGKCEKICPQHLNIRDLLVKIKDIYE